MTKQQIVSTYTICQLCGHPLPEQKTVGRPRVHCGDKCRRLSQILGWLEDILMQVNPTPEKKKGLRRRLWYLANLLNTNQSRKGGGNEGEARE